MTKKLRVIQWTTGKVGKLSLRGILDDPRLELVGVYAYSADKAGSDAGALCVWAHPSGQKMAEVPDAHDGRVLHTTLSPDGQTLATVGSDESLKFWRIFEQAPELHKAQQQRAGLHAGSYKGFARTAPTRALR